MVDKIDISHLNAEDLSRLLKESTEVEISRRGSVLDLYLGKVDVISKISAADIEKIAKLGGLAKIDGACGGGCC